MNKLIQYFITDVGGENNHIIPIYPVKFWPKLSEKKEQDEDEIKKRHDEIYK